MIKSKKIIKLSKCFKMQITQTLKMPSVIKDKDIYAMFCGLISIIKSQANLDAENRQKHTDYAYQYLLKMYENAVKNMNKYKALYFKLQKNNINTPAQKEIV